MSEISVQNCKSLTHEFSKAVLVWYSFRKNSRILYIYTSRVDEALVSYLEDIGSVDVCSCINLTENLSDVNDRYDYIVGMDIVEESLSPQQLLSLCRSLLKPDGRLLLGTENRLAAKFFCGDRDPYSNHSFDGVENYRGLTAADRENGVRTGFLLCGLSTGIGKCRSSAFRRSQREDYGLGGT